MYNQDIRVFHVLSFRFSDIGTFQRMMKRSAFSSTNNGELNEQQGLCMLDVFHKTDILTMPK